jgi:hypothetical protein
VLVLVKCLLVFTVFCIVCVVFLYCFIYVYIFLLVLSVLSSSDNSIVISNYDNDDDDDNTNNKLTHFVTKLLICLFVKELSAFYRTRIFVSFRTKQPLDRILSHMNPIHILSSYSF